MTDRYEHVIVAGFTGTPVQREILEEQMDDYGDNGYRVVNMTTVVHDDNPYTTFVMEKESEDHGIPPVGSRKFHTIPGGAS